MFIFSSKAFIEDFLEITILVIAIFHSMYIFDATSKWFNDFNYNHSNAQNNKSTSLKKKTVSSFKLPFFIVNIDN